MKSNVIAKYDGIGCLFGRNQQIWMIEMHVNDESYVKVISSDCWKILKLQ